MVGTSVMFSFFLFDFKNRYKKGGTRKQFVKIQYKCIDGKYVYKIEVFFYSFVYTTLYVSIKMQRKQLFNKLLRIVNKIVQI